MRQRANARADATNVPKRPEGPTKPEISTGHSQECREASRSKQYLGKARLGAWRRGSVAAWQSAESDDGYVRSPERY